MATDVLLEPQQKIARWRGNRLRGNWWLGPAVGRLALKHFWIAVVLCALSLGGRLLLLKTVPIPEPLIHDEFSNLLAAETFAHGRLTNPAHPLWPHFETVHELMVPSYQSKYPPAQALVLATGEVLFGHPWYGVWLSTGLMIAAIYWALAGWVPPRWALLGGVIALLKVGIITYWNTGYFGGSVTAAAGALVIGAVPRLRRRPAFKDAAILAAGLAILANARPVEGAMLGAAAVFAILLRQPLRVLLQPFAVILLPTFLWMAYYDYKVTGNALEMPYLLHHRQYESFSPFFWAGAGEPHPPDNNPHVLSVQQWINNLKAPAMTPIARAANALGLIRHYMGIPLGLLVLACLPFVKWKRPRAKLLLLTALPLVGLLATYCYVSPHYAAAGTAAYYVAVVWALRRFYLAWPAEAQWLLALVAIHSFWVIYDPYLEFSGGRQLFAQARASVLRTLAESPGKKVVFVDYSPEFDKNRLQLGARADSNEWVYNHADIDGSETVWALGLGEARDREVIQYYPGRQFWRLAVDEHANVTLRRINPAPLPSGK